VLTAAEAKRLANERLQAEGSPWVAGCVNHDRDYPAWYVGYVDPAAPDEMLFGGGPVVTDDGCAVAGLSRSNLAGS